MKVMSKIYRFKHDYSCKVLMN